jgi:hypothetical protein
MKPQRSKLKILQRVSIMYKLITMPDVFKMLKDLELKAVGLDPKRTKCRKVVLFLSSIDPHTQRRLCKSIHPFGWEPECEQTDNSTNKYGWR